MNKIGQFLAMLAAVILGLVVVIYAYAALSDPVSHNDVLEELLELENLVAENSCLLLLSPTELRSDAAIAECRTIDVEELE